MDRREAFGARRGATAGVILVMACLTTSCASAIARAPRAASHAHRPVRLSLIVAIGSVGAFHGRCNPDARRWTLEFRNTTGVDDLVYVRVGAGRVRRSDVPPGERLTWHLVPGASRSREPGDSISGNSPTTIPSTRPLRLVISQGSEPHIYRVDATLALAAAIGDTTDCAPVASDFRAATYFNGGGPAIP